MAVENVALIRKVKSKDHLPLADLFQQFQVNNNNANEKQTKEKSSSSLAGMRIDERGGMYLNPLLDTNTGYFKCFVAEENETLSGYILVFDVVKKDHNSRQDPIAVIQDIYVKPDRRRKGLGTQLFLKAVHASLEKGCEGLEINYNQRIKLFLNKVLSTTTWKKQRIASERFWTLTKPEMSKLVELYR